jgi:hypothetical protein
MKIGNWMTFVLGLLVIGTASSAGIAQNGAERQLVELVNEARSQQGLGPVSWDPALASAAQQHAQWVARSPQLSHQYPGEPDLANRASSAGARFHEIAENVAEGQSVDQLHTEWMNSPHHRANILDPRITSIGVAIVRRGETLFAVEDFSQSVPNLGPDKVEAKIEAMLQTRGVAPSASETARKTCAMDHGSSGGPKPMFIMRWQGTDLGRLPDALEERLQTGKYHRASVGACSAGQEPFSGYKVAVLLFY